MHEASIVCNLLETYTAYEISQAGLVGAIMVAVMYFFPFLFFFLIVIFVLKRKRKSNKQSDNVFLISRSKNQWIPVTFYNKIDKSFSEEVFKEKIRNLFFRIQDAKQNRDFLGIRSYFSEPLFEEYALQMEQLKKKHIKSVVEDPEVRSIIIKGFKQESDTDVMLVELKTLSREYTIDETNNKLKSGSKKEVVSTEYEWVLCRSLSYRGKSQKGFSARVCPNCGAAVNINKSLICEYCGSVLSDDEFDWVIISITVKNKEAEK